jgi:hypothetical protein
MWHKGEIVIEQAAPITVDGVRYPASIFTKWTEEELNAIGIHTLEVIKDELPNENHRHSDPILNFDLHTYTHHVLEKTPARLAADKEKEENENLEELKQAALEAEEEIRVNNSIENGTTPESKAWRQERTKIKDRRSNR